MISLLIVALIGVAIHRGFRRGAPRELVDLLVVAIGFPLAFRTGGPLGELLFGSWAPLASRTIGAVAIFGIISLAATALNRTLAVSELDQGDRATGALLGGLRGGLMSVVVLAIVAAAPTTSTLGQAAQRSWITSTVTDPDGPAMALFAAATGEDGVLALISFNRAFPDGPLVADDVRRIPSFPTADLEILVPEGIEILDLVNNERTSAGVGALTWSSALTQTATDYAQEMYVGGFFSHVSPSTGDVGSRLRTAGIGYSIAGENLALAPNVLAVHSGLMNSPGHRANILAPDFTHIGIGVVEGPIGLIVVQVFFRA